MKKRDSVVDGSMRWLAPVAMTAGVVSMAVACGSVEPHEDAIRSQSSALTTTYQGESMGFTGTGEVRSTPTPTHRFFWGDGYVSQSRAFSGGATTITVRAQGVLANGVGPHIAVSVGGVTVGDAFVHETTWASKTFTFDAAPGTQELRVTYDNDLHAPPADRGLLIDWVGVDECAPTSYEAEQMFHSTGGATTGGWNIWSSGYISTNHAFIAGQTALTVTAKGSVAAGVWPHMRVSVGGVQIGDVYVASTAWQAYPFTLSAPLATQEVRITYDNDFTGGGEDRNLMVDKVVVGCPTGGCAGSTSFDISAPLDLDHAAIEAGQTLTGSVTYKNCSSAAVSVQEVRIAGRRPGATHAGGPYDDLTPYQGPVTVPVGGTLALTASRAFTSSDPTGQWVSYATFKDSGGVWHDGPEVGFTVDPAAGGGTGGTPYPSGVAFRGINRAGLEYGDDWNGWTGQTFYDQPSHAEILNELAYLKAKGMNVIRLPISWERLQHQLYGALDAAYVSLMMDYIDSATAAGFAVVLDLHNYNRYAVNAYDAQGNQTSSYVQHTLYDGYLTLDHLRDVWVKLTSLVLDNPNVILNLMNESHDFNRTSNGWFADINTLIAAIRATGATHLILVPNSRSSDVTHWTTYSPNGGDLDSVAALSVTDSANNYAYDMHAYEVFPASCTSYRDMITIVTDWATTNQKRMFLSELGVSSQSANGSCAVNALLSYMNAHSDVWIGWTPWDLPPYDITIDYTADDSQMPWYSPFLTPNFLP
jgi:endoglucanase